MTTVPASRTLQRRLLAGLGGLTLLAMVWPLLLPHQPPLPELPAELPLPGGWAPPVPDSPSASAPLPTAPAARRFHPLLRKTALGTTRTLVRPGGQWLRLTPFASWTESAFSLDAARASSPALSDQPHQRCLSRIGTVGEDPLPLLIGWNKQPLSGLLRMWHVLVPVRNRSYACLLITTNAPSVFSDSAASRALRAQLAAAVRWPAPPGL